MARLFKPAEDSGCESHVSVKEEKSERADERMIEISKNQWSDRVTGFYRTDVAAS